MCYILELYFVPYQFYFFLSFFLPSLNLSLTLMVTRSSSPVTVGRGRTELLQVTGYRSRQTYSVHFIHLQRLWMNSFVKLGWHLPFYCNSILFCFDVGRETISYLYSLPFGLRESVPFPEANTFVTFLFCQASECQSSLGAGEDSEHVQFMFTSGPWTRHNQQKCAVAVIIATSYFHLACIFAWCPHFGQWIVECF